MTDIKIMNWGQSWISTWKLCLQYTRHNISIMLQNKKSSDKNISQHP